MRSRDEKSLYLELARMLACPRRIYTVYYIVECNVYICTVLHWAREAHVITVCMQVMEDRRQLGFTEALRVTTPTSRLALLP